MKNATKITKLNDTEYCQTAKTTNTVECVKEERATDNFKASHNRGKAIYIFGSWKFLGALQILPPHTTFELNSQISAPPYQNSMFSMQAISVVSVLSAGMNSIAT